MTYKEYWLKLFTENEIALAGAVHLCQRFWPTPEEGLSNYNKEFLKQKREELHKEVPEDVIRATFPSSKRIEETKAEEHHE